MPAYLKSGDTESGDSLRRIYDELDRLIAGDEITRDGYTWEQVDPVIEEASPGNNSILAAFLIRPTPDTNDVAHGGPGDIPGLSFRRYGQPIYEFLPDSYAAFDRRDERLELTGGADSFLTVTDSEGQQRGLWIDRYGVHLAPGAGPTDPGFLTSAAYGGAAPDTLGAGNGEQRVKVFYDPVSGTYDLIDTERSYTITIDITDDEAAVQAAFDAAYGASVVTINENGAAGAMDFNVVWDGASLDETRIELLRADSSGLTPGDTQALVAVRIEHYGKAIGLEAGPGTLYQRNNAGVGELWLKNGEADTAWIQVA